MKNTPDKETLRKLYYLLIKIRKFEEKIIELYPQQEMRTPVHLYIGQEAIASGVCVHLKKEDYVFSTHRNHGHLIAKGADLGPMFAELYGKKDGCSSGKGGSMHMIAEEVGIFGTSAIVAGGIPIGLGAALASVMKNEDRITVIFFGDGAVDEGTFYEGLNFAALKKLPVLFVCENNFYATNSPQKARQANLDISKISDFFFMPNACVDGNNLLEVYSTAGDFIPKIRSGQGPCFIEARTYRCRTHAGPETDIEKGLRAKEEVEEWLQKCPYKIFKQHLLDNHFLSDAEITEIERQIDREIEIALDFAHKGQFPTGENLNEDVY